MLTFLQRYKFIILSIVGLLVLSIIIFLYTQQKVYPYLRTQIGKTTSQDIEKLPNIKDKKDLGNGQTEYNLNSPVQPRDDKIVTNNDVAVFERVVTRKENSKLPKISEYTSKYGTPEKEITGHKYYGDFEKTYIYASKGIAIIGNPFTDELDEVQTFKSMTVDEYLKLWGSEIQENKGNTEQFNP